MNAVIQKAIRGNATPRHESLMHVIVTTHRAPKFVVRKIGKISC
ncbi:hypothetical protein LMG28688_01882 [Paraburkholderia caffeinitolerans]|uniref:Uncharacterized protein n=1 Tax=Paraburkholderia caffeinitolerans TaxID=1723730 RepID=A0A6J5FSI7_9BURK|nr:hypothetical protein LMG28688_01882 [Paraburkholderia caffeinitolerans]